MKLTRIVFSLLIERSKWMLSYLIAIHCLMLATSASLLCASYQFLVSFIYYSRRYQWLKSDKAIIQLLRDAEEQWYVVQKNGVTSPIYTLKTSFVMPAIVILNFERGKSITLCADSVHPDLLRQLRVYCRNPNSFSAE